ncbi:4Fe-4S dicluster domain-containing protein [Rhodospirillum rubrum]|uniref:4Fe-4S dicluster domain-containing protein n=1 Tax=Rhodospirillum rubrum TaxID=1085 RepID=UPI000229D6CD|nr:4Fe-4S dicluster domain-containing protein [Rhodospirillum rubrum]AEO46782.1 4Fe-4S ferredoxin, iron-sulfur binding protein [Rhodospirillum rubrum F11]QXG80806.1 4Fe-4S dicluster domain-containing protein [Rhodospirillum rubrum]
MKPDSLNYFILADSDKCIGCRMCEIACAVTHSEDKPETVGALDGPLVPRLFVVVTDDVTVPVICRHCEDAPCASVCKMAAISRVDGKVLVDAERCVGCRLCLMACPFGATEFVPQPADAAPVYITPADGRPSRAVKVRYKANKCDLCSGLADGPACVNACPQNVLSIVDPAAEVARRALGAVEDLVSSMKFSGL